jgi:hypothetical protein
MYAYFFLLTAEMTDMDMGMAVLILKCVAGWNFHFDGKLWVSL